MTKSFLFDVDGNTQWRVFTQIECRDHDGCDATFDIVDVEEVMSGRPVSLQELPDDVLAALERRAQEVADEYGPDAYRDWMRWRADAAYDYWKENKE